MFHLAAIYGNYFQIQIIDDSVKYNCCMLCWIISYTKLIKFNVESKLKKYFQA